MPQQDAGTSVTPQPVSPPVVQSNTTSVVYATFGQRLGASLLDGLIVGVVGTIISFVLNLVMAIVFGVTGGSSNSTAAAGIGITMILLGLIVCVLEIGYFVYFIGAKGQTLGKMALKIKVIKKDTGQVPGFGSALLRETIGKVISGMIMALGYLWMLWDKDKQTWHDKIAGTVVVKI